MIDLRSDTVTRPTPAMRKTIADAEVGDDVLGDDPTVIRLQEKAAKLLGKEAALFVPSGTMANQISIRTHTEAGDEVILEENSHVFLFETGALGGICGVQPQTLPGKRGILTAEQIKSAIRTQDSHFPPTKLVILENTHNHGGGIIYPLKTIQEIRKVCIENGLAMHMDGARLWNACIAADQSPKDYAEYFDSVSVCLSKGLGAPVGSLIVGSRSFIQRARRFRKMFGGGMRQSGILAAAGIYALDHHFERLQEDHDNAKQFAQKLAEIPNVKIDLEEVQTNIIYFGIKGRSPQWLEEELKKNDVWVFAERPQEVRAVTHMDVTRNQLDHALNVVRSLA